MNYDALVSEHALGLAGAYMTEQWGGLHVFKLGDNKMFIVLAPGKARITLKLPDIETRDLLVAAGVAQINVHFARAAWADLILPKLDPDDVRERITQSYELVRFALSKPKQATLPPYLPTGEK